LRLALDADPVGAGVRPPAERVVAQRRRALVDLDANGQVLAGSRGRQRRAARVLEPDRDDRVALVLDLRDGQLPETGPGRRRAGLPQAGVPAAGVVEEGAERSLPAGAEGRDPECSRQLRARVPGAVEQPVDLGDRHLLGPRRELGDRVSRLHLALFQDAEVEAGALV